jgi:hypothetical protein
MKQRTSQPSEAGTAEASEPAVPPPAPEDGRSAELREQLAAELKARVGTVIDEVVKGDSASAQAAFEHVLGRVRELFARKKGMEGSKNATRDLLSETMYGRLRSTFATTFKTEAADPAKAAETVVSTLVASSAFADVAVAVDKIFIEAQGPKEFSFAGLTDFISVEEVLQLLGSGKHTGCLSLENPENRLDVYLHSGRVAFLDPHRLVRRVLPTKDPLSYREITKAQLAAAERAHAEKGIPLVMALEKQGVFRSGELREACRVLACEVLYEFLQEEVPAMFSYRRLVELPPFAVSLDMRLGVTPILLEGSKRMDDLASMRKVFPDPDEPLRPVPDIYSRIGSLNLGVIEIKLLSLINGSVSPRRLVPVLGLPLFDIYQILVRFAREGIINPPNGYAALLDINMNVEDSMAIAFAALDANDDKAAVGRALDRVLGVEEFTFDSLKASHRKQPDQDGEPPPAN